MKVKGILLALTVGTVGFTNGYVGSHSSNEMSSADIHEENSDSSCSRNNNVETSLDINLQVSQSPDGIQLGVVLTNRKETLVDTLHDAVIVDPFGNPVTGEQIGEPYSLAPNAEKMKTDVLAFELPSDGYYLATVRTAFTSDGGERGVRDDSLRFRVESGIVQAVDRQEYEEFSSESVAQKL